MVGVTEQGFRDGRSARWADHRATRREELVQVARKVVHHQGPDASMDEIAAAAGTSKSIVYRYFTDKAGLQTAVGQAVVDQMQQALEEAGAQANGARESLRAMVEVYLEMIESSPNVYYFVTRPVTEAASVPLGHFLEAVAERVAAPFARVLGGDGPAARAWAAGAVGFVRGAGEWWLSRRDDPDRPARAVLAERITTWLWSGPIHPHVAVDTQEPS